MDRQKLVILIIIILLLPVVLSLVATRFDISKIFPPIPITPKPVQKEVKIEYIPQPAVAPNLQEGPYQCPSVAAFCAKSIEIIRDNKYEGIGTNIPAKSPIYAAFSGTISAISGTLSAELGGENITTVYLDNREKGLRAVYTYQGEAPQPQDVKEGDTIARVGEKINLYGVPLVFKLIKGDPLLGEAVKLKGKDFK